MLPKSNRYCGGFTLLEVMLVVVISVTAMMFAVPAFKKAQARAQYMDASGVLLELANATNMLAEEYPSLNISGNFSANSTYTGTSEPVINSVARAIDWMQFRDRKYLSKVKFVSGKYKGYTYAFSTQGNANCGSGCTEPNAVACMANAYHALDAYKCVWVSKTDSALHNKETN